MIEGCLELRHCQMWQFWERVSLRKLHPTFTLLFYFPPRQQLLTTGKERLLQGVAFFMTTCS